MNGVSIEGTLESLINSQIIDLFFKMQEHTNSTIAKLTDEIRNSNFSFKRLKSDVEFCKKENDALVKQVTSLELQRWRNVQYSRMECVEIRGIPNPIVHSDLEKRVCKALQHREADIFEEKIELCHRINKTVKNCEEKL